MKRWLAVCALTAAALVAVASLALYVAYRSLDNPLQLDGNDMTFVIAPGTSFGAISNALARQGAIPNPQVLRWYASITGKANFVHAGEYRLEQGMTVRDLLDRFLAGAVELHSFTIIEGWNIRELMAAIGGSDVIEATLSREDIPGLLELIGAAQTHPEGLFLPETYRFPRGTRDTEVLRQAYNLMQETLADEWSARDPAVPLSDPYHALILASIVEKETGRADERGRIAGVFARRLNKGMRLQTDPTVIYGIGETFDGNLTKSDLQTDTPYNTYTRHGLPPTPIAMPGREAIRAALHPEPGNELYFVATGLGDGSHTFSETLDQHEAAVRELVKRQRANRQSGRGK